MPNVIDVVVETGAKRVFASATDFPGWARSGRHEPDALANLAGYVERYRAVLSLLPGAAGLAADPVDYRVIERLPGNATTDFGAPGAIAAADARPLAAGDWARLRSVLAASWEALDHAAEAAAGRELRTGPRGGGRDVPRMLDHVREAERAYVSATGATGRLPPPSVAVDPAAWRLAVLGALDQAAAGGVPQAGSRGGRRWPLRYAVRRAAWHVLDHAWEIQDRLV